MLATLMALVAVNVWTGAPLLALWVGSRVQRHSEATMTGIAVVAITLAVICFALLRVLRVLSARYDRITGTSPTVRTHVTWLRSMRAERPQYEGVTPTLTMAERIVILMVVIAFIAFEIWFFFFSTSSIDQRSGRGEAPTVQHLAGARSDPGAGADNQPRWAASSRNWCCSSARSRLP
jgi:hypothetical protein